MNRAWQPSAQADMIGEQKANFNSPRALRLPDWRRPVGMTCATTARFLVEKGSVERTLFLPYGSWLTPRAGMLRRSGLHSDPQMPPLTPTSF
jgi:hypothetical protein